MFCKTVFKHRKNGVKTKKLERAIKMKERQEKIKTLIHNILLQCEEQGLTEFEVSQIPELLKNELRKIKSQRSKDTKFHL